MRKTELNFQVNIRSGKRTPLEIEISYRESGIRKSMYIYGKERAKSTIASLISDVLNGKMRSIDFEPNEYLDSVERIDG